MEINEDGKFVLTNHGRRPVYVDGQPVLTDNSVILNHNQLLEVNYQLIYNCLPYVISSYRFVHYHFLFYSIIHLLLNCMAQNLVT